MGCLALQGERHWRPCRAVHLSPGSPAKASGIVAVVVGAAVGVVVARVRSGFDLAEIVEVTDSAESGELVVVVFAGLSENSEHCGYSGRFGRSGYSAGRAAVVGDGAEIVDGSYCSCVAVVGPSVGRAVVGVIDPE